MTPDTTKTETRAAEGSSLPLPLHIPRSTAWPFGLAFGITLLLWGIVTAPVVVAIGAGVVAVSLVGWVKELLHEHA